MFLFQILAFLIIILFLSKWMKEDFLVILPVGTAAFILVLYILAFFRILSASDYLAMGIIALTVANLVRMSKVKRKEILSFTQKQLLNADTIISLLMLIIITICVGNKVTSWWDDINFWATDVKSIFYLDGFAGKYMNAVSEFGDYPPGTQLFKWWFLHFSPEKFHEGLMFAGYYVLNFIFLLPMIRLVKNNRILYKIIGAVILWFFPAVCEVFWCDGTCADLTMAVIYGAFMVSVVDKESHTRLFYYGRQALLLSVLVLCKNTAFLWAAFGILFTFGYHLLMNPKASRKESRIPLLIVTIMPVITQISWLIFCLANRRVAKLTGAAVHMVTGSIHLPDYQSELLNTFVKAFTFYPLHRWKTIGIDLSPLLLFLLFPIIIFILVRLGTLQKRPAIWLSIFYVISGATFYIINLICHLTIFATETQYLDPFAMVSSIERYGAPFTIGGLYLLAFLFQRKAKTNQAFLICCLFVLLTTDLAGGWRALWGYRNTTDDILMEREEIIDTKAHDFLSAIGAGREKQMGRILYLRDISDVSWVRNTYISFEAAPLSVMYGNLDGETMQEADVIHTIENSHAGFLYVEPMEQNGQRLFENLIEGELKYAQLYQICQMGEKITLIEYPETIIRGNALWN